MWRPTGPSNEISFCSKPFSALNTLLPLQPYKQLLRVMYNLLTIISILPWLLSVSADSNGMDMSMDGAMAMSTGNMFNYLHFTPGDNLWFLGWVPASAGAMVGTCIALCLLGIVERLIAGVRGVSERHWEKR